MPASHRDIPQDTAKPKGFVRAYQVIAIMITNVLLMSLLTLGILSCFFPADDLIWAATKYHRYSTLLDHDAYYLIDHGDLEQIGREHDALALSGHWQVHPWTGLINRQFKGRFLNIDQDGRRQTIPVSTAHKDKPPLIIWAFGGSTLFGWGLSDQYTLPSALQVDLQKRLPDRAVQCINFGTPWYNSSHEAALFIANLRSQQPLPDVAIFLDGYNDLSHIVVYNNDVPLLNELNAAWEARIRSFTTPPPWIILSPNLPIFRLARKLRLSQRTDPAQKLGGAPEEGKAERLQTAISRYHFNRKLIRAVGQEFGVPTYFFLQPVPYWTEKDLVTINQPDFRAFDEAFNKKDDGDLAFDLTGALSTLDPKYRPTVDNSHYSDVATTLLAERMAEVIRNQWSVTSDK